jgi:AraC-like DNA-binding protein
MECHYCTLDAIYTAFMNVPERGTISAAFIKEALLEATKRGIDVDALLDTAGIPTAVLNSAAARVSPEMYGRMWNSLADRLNDEFFGVDSHGMKRGTFTLLCHCVLHTDTLEQALSRALRFLNIVLDDFQATLDSSDENAEIRLVDRSAGQRLFSNGAYLLIVHGLACWLTKRRIPILAARFRSSVTAEEREYRTLFGPDVEYACDRNALIFDARLLTLPVRQNSSAMKQFLRDAPASFLVKYKNTHSTAAKVRRMIRRTSPTEWPGFEELAQSVGASASTLRRRLEDEGCPYQMIKDELRRDMSLHLLQNTRLSIMEIAFRVGFNETSTFHRAFRRWTGLPPGQFRESSKRI